jgi:tRNA dimethylallyltransferase
VTGATASGKGALARAVARRLGAEIVSMDSMKVYRGMDVGTAKPGPAARAEVPHHLLDVVEPWEEYDAARWVADAEAACRDVEARGRRALLVGGTPLYLKSLLHGIFSGPSADPALRAALVREAETAGPEALHARLAEVDAATAARLHPRDVRRVVRALEVWEKTGRAPSALQREWAREPRAARIAGLRRERRDLDRRIGERVRRMMAGGFLEEVARLGRGAPLSRGAEGAAGYAELRLHLEGKRTLEEAVERTVVRTRQIARRQLTWLRSLPGVRWFDVPPGTEAEALEEEVARFLE